MLQEWTYQQERLKNWCPASCHDCETRQSHIVDHTGHDDDFSYIQASAMVQRDSEAVDPASKLCICVAWANTEELHLFKRHAGCCALL